MTALSASTPALNDDTHADLHCPLCEYNLRGLVEPRCPECGYGAESWEQFRQRIHSTHPYLFEHHPERKVASFVRTLLGGVIAWRFWRTLQPHHDVKPVRLVIYWIICILIALLPAVVLMAQAAWQLHQRHATMRQTWVPAWNAPGSEQQRQRLIRDYGSLEAAADAIIPLAPSRPFWQHARSVSPAAHAMRGLVVLGAAWPLLVLLTMSIFRTTLRTARICRGHIARCGVYGGDLLLWVGLLALAACAWAIFAPPPRGPVIGWLPAHARHMQIAAAIVFATPVLFLLVTIRLALAFRLYLHLRHAIVTAVLVQIVIALFCMIVRLNVPL